MSRRTQTQVPSRGRVEEDTVSGSSGSDGDDFDSEDDRVNMVPGQENSQSDSSSDSDEEESPRNSNQKIVSTPQLQAGQHRQFDSDVESEYDTDSSSESEGVALQSLKEQSPQKNVASAILYKGSPAKGKNAHAGDDHLPTKQQQETPMLSSGKREALKNLKDQKPFLRERRIAATEAVVNDNSIRNNKSSDSSSRKRNLDSLQQTEDADRDSADSAHASKKKKKKDVDKVVADKKSSATKKELNGLPRTNVTKELSTSKKNEDRDNLEGETPEDISKKALSSPPSNVNGSKSMVEHTPSAAPRSKKEKLSINQPVSSSKSKKIPHMWSAEEEIFMLSEVLNHIKMGFEVPTSKVDDFWSSFSEILQKKVGLEFTREQVNDKFKRLRQRYLSAMQRINASQQSGSQFKHRNSGDQTLFDLSGQIWGKQQASDLSQQEVASGPQNDPSKSNQIPLKATKSKNGGSPNSGSHIAPNDSTKPDSTRITDDNLGENRTVIVGSNEPDTLHIVKGDYEEILANAPLDHVEKLVQERIETAINDLQEWSKRNMEDWMSRTYSLLEESMRKFEEQMRSMSCAGYGNGGLVIPTRFGDTMSYEFMNRDGGIQQQWYDLHLQELRVQAQRLELMRRECELKQEQVKTQFLEQKRNQLS